MNLNKAFIIGRLTRDPEMRTTASGQSVTTFGVATNRVWNNQGERQEKTEFHNIVAWGKLAEICHQYLNKGKTVLIEGRIETRSWEGQDGVKRQRTEIVADNMQMGPRTGGESQPRPTSPQNQNNEVPVIDEETPIASPSSIEPGTEEIEVDDIPF